MLIFIPLRNVRKTQIFYVFREHKREYWPEMGQATTILARMAQIDLNLMSEMLVIKS